MELFCYRCGSPVESGILFCRHCGAPQIRVAVDLEQGHVPAVERLPEIPEPLPPPSAPSLNRTQAWTAIIIAGLLEAAFALFGFLLIGIPVGAFFSVSFYKRRVTAARLNSSIGARLGLFSGAVGFVAFALVASLAMLFSNTGADLRQEVMKQLEHTAAQYPAQAQQMLDFVRSSDGWGFIVAVSTIFFLFAFLILSTIGGALGGALLGRKDTRSPR